MFKMYRLCVSKDLVSLKSWKELHTPKKKNLREKLHTAFCISKS